MTVFWILLLSTTCHTQYTGITGLWDDDYIVASTGWEYHDSGIIDGTNHSYHGYYLGAGGGMSGPSMSLRENYEIERMFYCNTYNSSVDITYTVYYCNCDNAVNDYVELSVNGNTAQTTDASSGIFMGSAMDGLLACDWYSKSSATVSIPLVIVNNLFNIHFKISLNYQGETIALSNIQIICHPLTLSPTTRSPTTRIPTVTPTNDPTMEPIATFYPTMNPTFGPTSHPTKGPTTSAPTTSEPTKTPSTSPSTSPSPSPSHLATDPPSYWPTIYSDNDKEVDNQHVTTAYNHDYDGDNKQSNTNNINLTLIAILIVICLCIGGVSFCFMLKRRQNNLKHAKDTKGICELVTATHVQIVPVASASASDNEPINLSAHIIDDRYHPDTNGVYIETLGNNIGNNATNGGDNENENGHGTNEGGTGTESADFEIVGDDEVTIGQQTDYM